MRRLVVLVILLGMALTSASCTTSPAAATVGSSVVSRSALDAQLSAIAANTDAACVFSAEFDPSNGPVSGAGQGTVSATVAAAELDNLVVEQILQQDLRRHGVTLSAADVAAGRADLAVDVDRSLVSASQSGSLPPACASLTANPVPHMPAIYGSDVARFLALQEQFRALVGHVDISAGAVRSYYANHASEFRQACVDLVVADTQAAAQAIDTAVSGGEAIAVAASGPGADTQITPPGGQLSCQLPTVITQTFGSGDAALIYAAKPGQVLAPMAWTDPATGGSYWLAVQVRSLPQAPEAAVSSQIRQQLLAPTSAVAQRSLQALVRSADVHVDPRFGTWRPKVGLVPPAAPPSKDVLDPAANQATSSSGS